MIESSKQKNKPCCMNGVRIFLWLIFVLTLSSCVSANNFIQVTRENLYEEVKSRAIVKDKPAFATAGVVNYLESMGSQNKQIKKMQWSSVSKYEVFHLETEGTDNLVEIATKNIAEIIRSKKQIQIETGGGVFVSKGLSPRQIKWSFEGVCGADVNQLLQREVLIISYQEKSIPQDELCESFAWIFAGNGINIISSDKGNNIVIWSN